MKDSAADAALSGAVAGPSAARRAVFQAVLGAGILGLGLIIARTTLMGRPFPWADALCLIAFAAIFVLVRHRPQWLSALSWAAFAALVGDVVDGLQDFHEIAVSPTHLLLPGLVAYGSLLGDGRLTLVGMVVVLAIYAASAAAHAPLSQAEVVQLANLSILSSVLAAAGFLVWREQNRLRRELEQRAQALRNELDVNKRLVSLVTHDIANPLTVIHGSAELLQGGPGSDDARLRTIAVMAGRIAGIVEAVRGLQAGGGGALISEPVLLNDLAADLQVLFEQKLNAKEQQLRVAEGGALRVQAHATVLCHSVVGNFVGNAIKFSPRGALIELAAFEDEPGWIRVEVRDRGCGMAAQTIEILLGGGSAGPTPAEGTEGESGTGAGLRIAALCVQRLGGKMILEQRSGGGTIAAAVVPAAMREPSARKTIGDKTKGPRRAGRTPVAVG